ncbi:mitochondrial import receptor subunit TOM6 homolog [Pelodytes ibericus]
MAPADVEKIAGGPGALGCVRGAYNFITDRNNFYRNLILNAGLFAAGVWVARNLTDIDLMAPPPGL